MAEPKTPWLYPYREDPQQTRLGQPVFRPFVPVSLAVEGASTPELEGLIDTGADAILASDLLADELGLDLGDNEGKELHAVGGRTVVARYNVGFLDHFTVTASRFSQAVAVEDRDGFDDRFGVVMA